ncbi:glycoside hydrolase family 3 N-terminal domain-containing protein [Flavivirga abyssicola]|uniref:glycoside hydrolase family 3 N-terminal domain-containing protein n=1 Tax=Flavivirga abyssicola TaxID=3063533 RepID=UPI0026DF3106|nr:glycoside hydrolase family 3 N-terminal domain-containing protein [Flavivirga sp. MEBiC07777]WVK11653.1 glycoside hydrolase family 3 N-terminal domain-containing protein [Flavivirga sp. MEBiC07777]
MKKFAILIISITTLFITKVNSQTKNEIFTSKYNEKINKLISQMTLEEKVHQLATQYPNANMRLGIPNLSANECLHGIKMNHATVFPQAIAMASTWDENLIERMGHIVAEESRAYGIHQCYTPMLAVVRDVRWGRTEESYGEDPYLVGKIGAAYIKGLQGMGAQRFDKNHIIATAKHYVADGEPMSGDNGAAMDISDYNLHNVHLYPFKLAIEEANVGAIMPAHHLLNGIPCHANTYIMNDILRGEFGWDGLVVSDNGDMRSLHSVFNYATSWEEAAKKGLQAGIHQELALFQGWSEKRMFGDHLINAVNEGIVSMSMVDNAVAHVLRAKFQMGLFDRDVSEDDRFDVIKHPDNGEPDKVSQHDAEMFKKALYVGIPKENWRETVFDQEHNDLALEVAHKSIVLLKNENRILPIQKKKYKHIAVIGPNANSMRLGGYSPDIPKYYISIYEGIKNYIGKSGKVSFAEGCDFNDNTDKIDEAVALAKEADIVILAIGGSEETCRENQDVDNLHLPENQQLLEKAIQETGKPYVAVLLNGRPIAIESTAKNAPAILEGWYLGQETGNAVANVLFGEVNPSGKLPITFPRNAGQTPLFYNKLETGRPRNIYKSDPTPLYAFGYGLSYTNFEIGTPKLEKQTISADGKTTVSVSVKNTGDYPGEEVVQLYVRDLTSERVRPAKELRNFKRVYLKPGETKTVTLKIGKQQLEYWNDGDWKVEPGAFKIMVGGNSESLKSTDLMVE